MTRHQHAGTRPSISLTLFTPASAMVTSGSLPEAVEDLVPIYVGRSRTRLP